MSLRFGQKTSKKWVFRGLQVCTKTLRNCIDDAQTHYRMAFELDAQGDAQKRQLLFGKNLRFEPKKPQKIGFFGVFRSALKRFGIVLYDSDDAQIYKMAFQWDPQGVPRIKLYSETFVEKKKIRCVFQAKKTSKK